MVILWSRNAVLLFLQESVLLRNLFQMKNCFFEKWCMSILNVFLGNMSWCMIFNFNYFRKTLDIWRKKIMFNSLLTVETYNIFIELQFSLQYIHYLNSLFYRFSTILKHWVIVNALKLYRHVLSFFMSYWNNSLF